MTDPYHPERFLTAQAPVYDQVCAELREGRKHSHWMWFIFPQIAGLGHSPTAEYFAISSLAEARAYVEHEVLGPRLRECTRLVNHVEGRSIADIFGWPDELKFRSCMTLFARAAPENQVFKNALDKYFGGEEDALTVARL